MKIYVLSWLSDDKRNEDGVYGVYSSLEHAKIVMNNCINTFHETILNSVCDTDEWLFFTSQGLYKIEAMFLDDNAGV